MNSINSLNSLTKLFPNIILSSIKSRVVLNSIIKQNYSTSKQFSTNNNNISSSKSNSISHQNSTTKIPNGFFKITLKRSTIGLPLKRRRVARALGLRRLQQTVYHSQTAYIAGMILKIKEILQVKNVKRIPAPEERRKKAEKGYVIIKKHNPSLY